MWKFLRAVAWIVGIFAVLAGLLRLTCIRWWQVPTGDPYLEASIAPSLRGGDWIILWRGTKASAGDLVLCPEPKTNGRVVIGRVIGEKSDHVKLLDGGMWVDGRAMDSESGCDRFPVRDPSNGQELTQGCRIEIVAGTRHLTGLSNPELPKPRDADVDVTTGQVFLVSDNRQFPYDSREFGTVERSTCTETVVFRLVSKDGFFDVANRLMLVR